MGIRLTFLLIVLIITLVLSRFQEKDKETIMDPEEIAKKYSMNDLRPLAKKYGIPTRCIKKIDIVKSLPPEALAQLK